MAWLDQTVRLTTDPEIDVLPDGEWEFSWELPEMDGGRFTVLVSRETVDRVVRRTIDMLEIIPGGVTDGLIP